MEEICLWIWLTSLKNMTSSKINRLLDCYGSVEAIYRETNYHDVEGLSPSDIQSLKNKSFDRTKEIIEDCKQFAIHILTYDNPRYPQLLKHIFDPPYVLYVRGQNRFDLNEELCIAMVGTRTMQPYGREIAMELGRELAKAGILVVSGMAGGIDAASHWGALSGDGKTVAVLGCGAEHCYPSENRELMEHILQSGMIVSEYPPGALPLKEHFPVRNRIISGLCRGTIVVEAPERSGALITARLALEQDRDVFAVPGNLHAFCSVGTNNLIKSGAKLVTSALDIVEEYRDEYLALLENAAARIIESRQAQMSAEEAGPQKKPDIDSEAYQQLPEEERKLVEALSLTPVHIDTLVAECSLPPQVVSSHLTMLEMQGLIKRLPGNNFVLQT